ncbi:MAG: hypothetical protein GY953_52120, partial [bacterium]|nr:hypothetical protein [bacterium]
LDGGKLTPAVGESEIEVALSEAPAFENAVQSLEPVAAMATARELSEAIAGHTPESPDGKVSLFPVVCGVQTVAVLYAHRGEAPVDGNALELLTTLAGAVLDAEDTGPKPPSGDLVSITGADSRAATAALAWSELSIEDQDRHLRAQRFSRVQVAELRLYKSQAVKEGRIARDLYGSLRT